MQTVAHPASPDAPCLSRSALGIRLDQKHAPRMLTFIGSSGTNSTSDPKTFWAASRNGVRGGLHSAPQRRDVAKAVDVRMVPGPVRWLAQKRDAEPRPNQPGRFLLVPRRASSRRRQHLVPAIISGELSAALPLDRGTARGWRGVRGDAEAATQPIGAAAGLAGGVGRAGGADAEHQQCGGGNLDR